LPAPFVVREQKAEQAGANPLTVSFDEARSQASTTATSSPSMDPTVPCAATCGNVSPTTVRGQIAEHQAAQGGAVSVTHSFTVDAGALAEAFPEPKQSPVVASWQSMIPASAAAVPCDHAGMFEDISSYIRLEGDAGGMVGGSDGMDLDAGWAEAGAAVVGSPPRQEVLWPVRQLHRGFPSPADSTLRAAQEQEQQQLMDDPFLRRPRHRGYPDPAERERFEQHMEDQFLRHYPITPLAIEREGGGLVDDTEMAGLNWDCEQGQDIGALQEPQGGLGGGMGCWEGDESEWSR